MGGGGSLKSPELVKWTAPPWRRDENLSDINNKEPLFHQLLKIIIHKYFLVFQS